MVIGRDAAAGRLRRALWSLLVACLVVLAWMPRAQAQSDEARLVVLDVPGGGTERLTEALGTIEGVELYDQAWFIEQLQERGFKASGIMNRPKDLHWVMKGASIDYVIFLKPEGEDTYAANVVEEKTGEPALTFSIDRTDKGLSEAGAELARREIADFLGKAEPEAAIARVDEEVDEPEPVDPNEIRRQAAQRDKEILERLSKDWLWARAKFRMLRRDLSVADANRHVLAHESPMYPGLEAMVEAYPLGSVDPEYAPAGFYLSYTHGFDSVAVTNAEGEDQTISITHLEIEGGSIYRIDSPLGRQSSAINARVRIKAGVRYVADLPDDNPVLPETSNTQLVFGGMLNYPAIFDRFAVQGQLEFIPLAFWGGGQAEFGESSFTYGFAARLGALYAWTDHFGLEFGYGFRVLRTTFEGSGASEFEDAQAFELVQGLDVGVLYQY